MCLEIWFVAFIGGLVGSVLMDLTESQISKFGINSGVNGSYIGRWVKGLFSGVLTHMDIRKSAEVKNEALIGLIFHFIAGGGLVALAYPVFILMVGNDLFINHIIMSIIFGLLTSILPWFILMPAFGWGFFGVKGPAGTKPVLSPLISHISYGLGIGITLVLYYEMISYVR